jgi:hypothetical protein
VAWSADRHRRTQPGLNDLWLPAATRQRLRLRPGDRVLLVEMQSELVIRRSGRGGHSASEHLISALRCLYRRAGEDGLITPR